MWLIFYRRFIFLNVDIFVWNYVVKKEEKFIKINLNYL